MAKQASEKFSARTKDAVSGGGINGAVATIEKARFLQEFTYGGRFRDKPSAAIELTYDPGFEWKPENYTLGPSELWKVSKDATTIVAVGGQGGLNDKSAGHLIVQSIEQAAEAAGLDIDDLLPHTDEGNGFSVDALEGKTVRLKQVEFETAGGDKKEKVVIAAFVTKGKVETKGNGKASSDESVEEKTSAAIRGLLEDESRIKFNDLGNLIFDAHRKDPDAKKMMKLAMSEDFISDIDGVSFDKKKGVLTAEE